MKPSPHMQRLITQLTAKHGLDLSQPRSFLRLTMPDRDGCLVIESDDGHQVSISRCFEDAYGPYADPYILLLMDYPAGWLPLDLFYSPTEWAEFEQRELSRHGAMDDPESVDLVTLTEYWATLFVTQGWLERGVKDESTH
jgi:hypothetical protein